MTSFSPDQVCQSGVNAWLGSFYHRVLLLRPDTQEVGIGYFVQGRNATCCIDPGSGPRGKDTVGIVMYPGDGQKQVPLKFAKGELPNPLPEGHEGAAGYPVTITFTQKQKVTNVDLRLLGPDQREVPCYVSSPESPANAAFANYQFNTVCAIPKQAPGKRHDLHGRVSLQRFWQAVCTDVEF